VRILIRYDYVEMSGGPTPTDGYNTITIFTRNATTNILDLDTDQGISNVRLITYDIYTLIRSGFYIQGFLETGRKEPLVDISGDFYNIFRITGFDKVDYPIQSVSVSFVFKSGTGEMIGGSINGTILSACIVINKQDPATKNIYSEIWSLVSNPSYLRSGAVKYMLQQIMYTMFDGGGHSIYLEVARDSFPYISFYDRFMLYVKMGFTPVPSEDMKVGAIQVIGGVPQETTIPLNNFRFMSDIYTAYGESTAVTETTSGVSDSLDTFKASFPLFYPTSDRIIMMITGTDISKDKIEAKLSEPLKVPVKVNEVLPTEHYGFLSHSSYQLGDYSFSFKTSRVPENVEIIIMNTPGYPTGKPEVIRNWNINEQYLKYIPIQVLQQYFPGFKSDSSGFIPTPHMGCDKGINFLKATSGSIYFDTTDTTYECKMQNHCYKPGDYYPDLQIYFTTGSESTEPLLGYFGLYTIPPSTSGVYKSSSIAMDPTTGAPPDQTALLWPPGKTTENKQYVFNLSDLIEMVVKEGGHGLKRITIFSCGSLDTNPALNDEMKAVSRYRLGQHISLKDIPIIQPDGTDLGIHDKYEYILTSIIDSISVAHRRILVGGKRLRRYKRNTKRSRAKRVRTTTKRKNTKK
jgi:hypothetical protein